MIGASSEFEIVEGREDGSPDDELDADRKDASDDDVVDDLDDDVDDDVADEDDPADDNVGDLSVEINVEELVAKIESTDAEEAHRKAEVRKRLEEIREQKNSDLDSTYNFNINDDD